MLCKNKLANLDFKSKKIMQNTFCFPLYIYIYIYIYINHPRMKWMNSMQCKSQKQRKQKLKNNNKNKKIKSNGHKEQSKEAQGPCQKDSLRLSLLHPKLFRYTTSIGVLIHIRMISNFKIGIKVKSLYQFTNKYYRIL